MDHRALRAGSAAALGASGSLAIQDVVVPDRVGIIAGSGLRAVTGPERLTSLRRPGRAGSLTRYCAPTRRIHICILVIWTTRGMRRESACDTDARGHMPRAAG